MEGKTLELLVEELQRRGNPSRGLEGQKRGKAVAASGRWLALEIQASVAGSLSC